MILKVKVKQDDNKRCFFLYLCSTFCVPLLLYLLYTHRRKRTRQSQRGEVARQKKKRTDYSRKIKNRRVIEGALSLSHMSHG